MYNTHIVMKVSCILLQILNFNVEIFKKISPALKLSFEELKRRLLNFGLYFQV